MKDVRKYAIEQAISEEEALAKGIAEPSAANWTILRVTRQGEAQRSQKSKGFVEKGSWGLHEAPCLPLFDAVG